MSDYQEFLESIKDNKVIERLYNEGLVGLYLKEIVDAQSRSNI